MWNLKKNGMNELIYKSEIVTDAKNKVLVPRVERRGG